MNPTLKIAIIIVLAGLLMGATIVWMFVIESPCAQITDECDRRLCLAEVAHMGQQLVIVKEQIRQECEKP